MKKCSNAKENSANPYLLPLDKWKTNGVADKQSKKKEAHKCSAKFYIIFAPPFLITSLPPSLGIGWELATLENNIFLLMNGIYTT